DREDQPGHTAVAIRPVLEREGAAVSLDDLAREHEADPAAAGLRREERHEEVVRIGNARAGIPDFDHGGVSRARELDLHFAAATVDGLDRILEEVDHGL